MADNTETRPQTVWRVAYEHSYRETRDVEKSVKEADEALKVYYSTRPPSELSDSGADLARSGS